MQASNQAGRRKICSGRQIKEKLIQNLGEGQIQIVDESRDIWFNNDWKKEYSLRGACDGRLRGSNWLRPYKPDLDNANVGSSG